MSDTKNAVAKLLAESAAPLFITGAGISADSGLPTYRGIGGLYEGKYTDEGMPIEDALSIQTLQASPDITWKYLWQIGDACRDANPNRGHKIITEIEKAKPDTWVMTQNVDGLHRKAGSRNLIEVHGRASELICTECPFSTSAEYFESGSAYRNKTTPICPQCGGIMRPDAVLFGEMLPDEAVRLMKEHAYRGPDLIFSIGTSAVFPYIREPVELARSSGIPTVEINPNLTELSEMVDYRLESRAADSLEDIWQR